MRAGAYAVWQGEVFECDDWESNIWLFRPTSQPRPEGFEYSRQLGWVRKFHISEVEHRFSVTTKAVWQGQHVEVDYVQDDKALVLGWSRPGEAPNYPSLTVMEKTGEWRALVPVYELTEVVEKYHDSI